MVVSHTYQHLRELIVRGRLAPGAWLVERELARRLGVSPTPVRAALHRLQQEGYIGTFGGESANRLFVVPLQRADMAELYFLVGDLEGWAAQHCAEAGRSTRTQVANRLRELNLTLAAHGGTADPDGVTFYELDAAFHQAIIDAGAGPRLQALLEMIKPQAERYDRLYMATFANRIALSASEHQDILRAIRRGDPQGARAAAMQNWLNAAERLGREFERRGDRVES